jgi:hypothetical protein
MEIKRGASVIHNSQYKVKSIIRAIAKTVKRKRIKIVNRCKIWPDEGLFKQKYVAYFTL